MGLGAGGVLTMSSVIVSDLVSLKERGLYNGVLGLYVSPFLLLTNYGTHISKGLGVQRLGWVLSSVVHSPNMATGDGCFVSICYSLKIIPVAIDVDLLDMNVPFAAVAAVLVIVLVKLPTPRGSLRSKIERIDWT